MRSREKSVPKILKEKLRSDDEGCFGGFWFTMARLEGEPCSSRV